MKKYLFLAALVALLFGCKKGEDGIDPNITVHSDCIHIMTVIVRNETDKVVTLTNRYSDQGSGWSNATIAPGTTYDEVSYTVTLGSCENKRLLPDLFAPENFVFGMRNTPVFRMSIDGKDVSDDIWLRKYWSFTPGYFDWEYTLTVTDRLLAILPLPDDDE